MNFLMLLASLTRRIRTIICPNTTVTPDGIHPFMVGSIGGDGRGWGKDSYIGEDHWDADPAWGAPEYRPENFSPRVVTGSSVHLSKKFDWPLYGDMDVNEDSPHPGHATIK